ncbi:hypothetical protein C2E23DRAFT_774053 [Lenzites betulinus]|nr:hypothetical protein C2E23DRAFT_774053 [Lenzites betulinus]
MLRMLSRSTSRVTEKSPAEVHVTEIKPVAEQEDAVATSDSPVPSSQQPSSDEAVALPQDPTPRSQKRFSWRSLVPSKGPQEHKVALPPHREEVAKEAAAREEYIERRILRTRSEKRAHASALVVRELIVGPFSTPTASLPQGTKVSATGVTSFQRMQKVKTQLLEPKTAQKVIAQLRQLPTTDEPIVIGKTHTGAPVTSLPKGPIHAVCLPYTDADAHEKHFSKLDKLGAPNPSSVHSPSASPKAKERNIELSTVSSTAVEIASVTATSLAKLKEVLDGLNIVSLITAPDLGLGQSADHPGLLSGALPSTDAIVNGIEQMTPQLLALGYATGKSVLPSHAGVYPPTDRMSVITYWWGLEVVMPEPSVRYLSNVPSIAHTVVNFLTALAVANGGVREILPFIRYISQYVDSEWNMITQADQGQGVVCAATWIMPAALVPRAWDFPQPPVASDPENGTSAGSGEDATPPANSTTPAPTNGSSAPSTSSPALLTPPLPDPNHAPIFVAPPGDPAVQTQSVPGNPAEGVPGVTVTPPTPPASETLGKAAGEAIKGAATATGASAGTVGEAPAPAAAA